MISRDDYNKFSKLFKNIPNMIAEQQIILDEEEKVMLQDLIVAATNDGLRKAKELGKEEMKQLTGGINIPGLSNIL